MSLKSVQCTWIVGLLFVALAVSGCGLLQKDADPQDAMVMENSETVEPDAKAEEPTTNPSTPPTVIPPTTTTEVSAPSVSETPSSEPSQPQRAAAPKNSMPDLPYIPGSEKTSEENHAADHESHDEAIQEPAPEPPAPRTAKPDTQNAKTFEAKSKNSKATKTVKFKLPQKSSASIDLSEKGQDLVLQLKASQIKKGKYWLFLEKSCKKSAAGKPLKLAIFNVKNGKKFSGQAKTRAATLKKDNKKGLKGKALVLYFGPKANDRLACSSVK